MLKGGKKYVRSKGYGMKKSFVLGAVIALCAQSIMGSDNLSTQEKELEKQTEWLRGERSLTREHFAKGVGYGAATGAVLGAGGAAVGAFNPDDTLLGPVVKALGGSKKAQKAASVAGMGGYGSLGGAIIGAMWSIPIAQSLQWWQRRKINTAVNEHLGSNFKAFTKPQAMLIVAAYKRNVPLMQLLIDRQPEFMNQDGVWQLLTELFYNQKPTKSRVKELQKMIQEA